MKTRELMTCDRGAFLRQVTGMKAKQLDRHIGKAAAALGEQDQDALIRTVVDALVDARGGEGAPPAGWSLDDELALVLAVIGTRIPPTAATEEQLVRLAVLCQRFLREQMRRIGLDQRRAAAGHDHAHCHDPEQCAEHGHHHDH